MVEARRNWPRGETSEIQTKPCSSLAKQVGVRLKVEDEAGQDEVERDEDGSHVDYLYTVLLYC